MAEKTSVPQNMAEKIFHLEYYFNLLVSIQDGEEIGCEIKDDCHIDFTKRGKAKLIQLKHTILTARNGSPKNLTSKDVDLWHTVSNWIDLICDENDNRKLEEDQVRFINDTSFSLVTNKVIEGNSFLTLILDYTNNKIDIESIKSEIKNLLNTEDERSVVDTYILKLLNKPNTWLSHFFSKININSNNFYDIRDATLKKLKERFRLSNHFVESIYDSYYSSLKDLVYEASFNKAIIINKETFEKGLEQCVLKYSPEKNYYTLNADSEIPSEVYKNFAEQVFIKQLVDIKAIENEGDILELTEHRYMANNSFSRWEMYEGEIDNVISFKKERRTHWQNAFKEVYNRKNLAKIEQVTGEERENLLIDLGQECLSIVRKKDLKYGGVSLQIHVCNGHFYWLSDIPEIGWRNDWNDRFEPKK
ncbi:hypothetical protein [Sporocytophaga myxococcoides]|uniref:hypothetical protein n=1 Tax=Sporocytophaga myxococcoides TaxID=153721 RepID=UPI0018CEF63F|nr:hypothetical protein [Sporocytophaga myxococcoides]